MAIEYCAGKPALEQFWDLFLTTGWNEEYHLAPAELQVALDHSWYCYGAYEGERLVGFGRVVSDESLHAMIYDMIVAPEYQGQGVGARILAELVQRCCEARIRDIQLFCARGKRGFYEKYGFCARPDEGPGMYYAGKREW